MPPELPGALVHVRDAATLDDVADLHAAPPVEAGDLIASATQVYRVEVVLVPPPGAPVVPVLARRIELVVAARPRYTS